MKGPKYSVIELLDRLVSFDTTSHKSNVALIRFVEDYLLQHGVVSLLVPNADGSKVSLYATIGPENVAGVALSGHTDVVPVVGQKWTSDPFTLTKRDGKLYGRGSTDMKGFLACMLAAVPDYMNRKLQVPIHLAFSYDEEIGCLGVRPMIAEFGKRLTMPRMVFVGEPTLMTVVDCHKGPVRWHVTIKGRAAHSSMAPLGVNTITVAGKLLGEIARIEAELKEAPQDARFDPPYATMQVTKIEGGTATNIVPVECTMDFDIRALPGVDIPAIDRRIRAFANETCLPDMQRVAPEAAIDIAIANQVPPFAAGEHSEAVALALRLAEQNETHAVSYATEAGLFQTGGSPSVVVGPGDIAQAHTADEWIAIEQLEKCSAFLKRLGDWAEHGSAVR
ncbi:acetylornithine deacetylase [Hyphomicrobium sulfonivorans]|uniref:acetylornithine deacetylase n=1 Tax=Hyphomicrobium sulfonivorans TaxID=121290 RepID=UPI0015710602|nr:acetylornithine deacetylase [Hyphomicrobium sulfonivorans]MBI1648276.1 acetylornithine deacetylase [Hyphomicrobium sulfonivorans]NSL71189.1 acetylornithine deacetylase [Hyphomicrobium sulfonivorans]